MAWRLEGATQGSPGNLLCVANFHTNAGYAWTFIEGLYAAIANDLAGYGVRTFVAYPEVKEAPVPLEGSCAEAVELAVQPGSPVGLLRLLGFIRRNDIRGIYLSDRPSWHPAYALLRVAGVRFLVVHDHTSGARDRQTGAKAFVKRLTRRLTPCLADVVLAVSEYVRRRKLEVELIPSRRVKVMLNSVEIPRSPDRQLLRERYGAGGRPLIVCACRAAEYKGVQHLLRAFDLVCERLETLPVLIYFGSGPYLAELERVRDTLKFRDQVVFAGYQSDAADLLAGADVCVVPSVWDEAFGLAALEPGARGVPVVASRVGGLPEVVIDRETGCLVAPGRPDELAVAITELLLDPEARKLMGRRARERAMQLFSRERQVAELTQLFRSGLKLTRLAAEPEPIAIAR